MNRKEDSDKDDFDISENGLSNEWGPFVGAFEKDYYGNAFLSDDLLCNMLVFSDDENSEPPFANFPIEDLNNDIFNEHLSVDLLCSDNQISEKPCITEPKPAAHSEVNHLQETNNKSSTEFEQVFDPKVLEEPIQTIKNENSSSASVQISCESMPKNYSKSHKKSKKKKGNICRTVITETIFNGSIGDIVKTRNRTTNGSSSLKSGSCDVNLRNEKKLNCSTPLVSICAENSNNSVSCIAPESKNCAVPKKEHVVPDIKKCHKQELRSEISLKRNGNVRNHKAIPIVPEEKSKKLIKSNVALHSLPVKKTEVNSSSSKKLMDKTSSENAQLFTAKTSSKNTTISKSPNRLGTKLPNGLENSAGSLSGRATLLNCDKESPASSGVIVPVVKRKLRGIEEYKAHKAKCKKEGKLSHVTNGGERVSLSQLILPSFKTNVVRNSLELSVTAATLPPLQLPAFVSVSNNSNNALNAKTVINSKETHCATPTPKKTISGNHLSLEMPFSISDVGINTGNCANTSPYASSPVEMHLPTVKIENCALKVQSSRIPNKLQNASHDIPADTIYMKSQSTKPTSATECCVPISNVSSCDTTVIKVEGSCNSPTIYTTAYLTQQKPSVNKITDEQSGPSTSAKVCDNEAKPNSKPLLPFMPVSLTSPNSKCHKKYRKSRFGTSSEDSDSSSSGRHSYCSSKYSAGRKKSSYSSRKYRRSRSRSRSYRTNSHRKSHSRSFSPRHRRRQKSQSRSRSPSTSSYSSSDDDFPYDIYNSSKMYPDHSKPSSLSPLPRRTKHSSSRSRSRRRFSRNYTSRHTSRSSRHRHSRHSASSYSRHKHSTSSSSTSNYHSYREYSSSTSRSQSQERNSYKPHHSSRSSRLSQQQIWEEQQRQIEERRVVYVGLIPDGYTTSELQDRFSGFGYILDVRIHKRGIRQNDNFGFVTFREKHAAYSAVEYGNADPLEPKFDISFGGRKGFCRQKYSDLDKENEMEDGYDFSLINQDEVPYDVLLNDEIRRTKAERKKH